MSLPKKLPPCNFFNLKDANYLLSSAHKPRAVMGKFTMMSDPEMIKEQSIYGPDAKWITNGNLGSDYPLKEASGWIQHVLMGKNWIGIDHKGVQFCDCSQADVPMEFIVRETKRSLELFHIEKE